LAFGQQSSTTKNGSVVGVAGDQPGGLLGMIKCTSENVRIPQQVMERRLMKRVQPRYPDDARQQRVEGLVALCAVIDTKGNVEELKLILGHPLLAPAALAAVKQWKYRPYFLNGKPVEVETQITVPFQLSAH
jgi:protein TonB